MLINIPLCHPDFLDMESYPSKEPWREGSRREIRDWEICSLLSQEPLGLPFWPQGHLPPSPYAGRRFWSSLRSRAQRGFLETAVASSDVWLSQSLLSVVISLSIMKMFTILSRISWEIYANQSFFFQIHIKWLRLMVEKSRQNWTVHCKVNIE